MNFTPSRINSGKNFFLKREEFRNSRIRCFNGTKLRLTQFVRSLAQFDFDRPPEKRAMKKGASKQG